MINLGDNSMEEFKGQTIFLSVIGVATLLVAIIGATFAWFNISASKEEESKNIVVTTASLSSIVFEDGSSIDAKDIFPGTDKTKTFMIAQTDATATETITYDIKLNVIANSLTPNANGAFVESLKGEGNINGGTLVEVNDKVVPTESESLGTGTLVGYETHKYTYKISLKNLDEDQSAVLGKEFNGYISANLINISK